MKLVNKVFLSNFNLLKLPYKLTFAITYRCNSRCKTCGIWKKKTKNELSLEEIKEFAEKSRFFSWVNLTGGEPFLRKDLVSIAESFIESKDFYLMNLTTNGLLPDLIVEKVEEIISLKPPRFITVVSLDGYKELHDFIRGVEGSWEKAVETYRCLRELSKEKKNFQTFLGLTISPFNVGEFMETFFSLREVIEEILPKDIHVNLFHSSDHYYLNRVEDSAIYKEKLPDELDLIGSLKGVPSNIIMLLEERYLKFAKKYVKERRTPMSCKVLQTSCFIDPEGNVYPCTIYGKKLGNLREVNFDLKRILKSKLAVKEMRKILKLKCPNCWTPCEAYQTILGNFLKAVKG